MQDPDVLDTWFSSALWPISTMGWPDPAAAPAGPEFAGMLEAFNPTSVLCTAREIITLWVSRMVMFNRYFMGEGQGKGPLPFKDVFIHAMIQDGQGRKMSKSLGNGVDPLDIIESHGADAMRFTLVQMTTQTQDVRMPVQKDSKTGKNTSPKFDQGRNFCNKLWNAARFTIGILEPHQAGDAAALSTPIDPAKLTLVDRWILSRLARTVREVEQAITNYEFSGYATAMYDLLWRDFCDWYLEAIKPTVAASAAQRAVLLHVAGAITRLLHPIMPFVTEAIWEHLGRLRAAPIHGITIPPASGDLLATAAWPRIDARLIDESAEAAFGELGQLVEAIRQVRAQHNVAPKKKITLHAPADLIAKCKLAGAAVETLAGLETMTTAAPAAGTPAVSVRLGSVECKLTNLADAAAGGAVDSGSERERLAKSIADKEKSIGVLQGRLANPGYADRAPPAMVQQTRDQLKAAQDEVAALKSQLAGMN